MGFVSQDFVTSGERISERLIRMRHEGLNAMKLADRPQSRDVHLWLSRLTAEIDDLLSHLSAREEAA